MELPIARLVRVDLGPRFRRGVVDPCLVEVDAETVADCILATRRRADIGGIAYRGRWLCVRRPNSPVLDELVLVIFKNIGGGQNPYLSFGGNNVVFGP